MTKNERLRHARQMVYKAMIAAHPVTDFYPGSKLKNLLSAVRMWMSGDTVDLQQVVKDSSQSDKGDTVRDKAFSELRTKISTEAKKEGKKPDFLANPKIHAFRAIFMVEEAVKNVVKAAYHFELAEKTGYDSDIRYTLGFAEEALNAVEKANQSYNESKKTA